MTGPEHYREAERLLAYEGEVAEEERGDGRAQAHATLALAAATAQNIRRNGSVVADPSGWTEVLGEPAPLEPVDVAPMDGAMHSVWLHGNWRFLTSKMTTEEREAAVHAVLRYDRSSETDATELLDRATLAWWDY